MNIKRYDFDGGDCMGDNSQSCRAEMREAGTGDYYSRADLIAAGCLVPVPDGEAGDVRQCKTQYFLDEDNDLYECSPEVVGDCRDVRHFVNGMEGFFSDVRVQPVRLVPLEDVG